jgi:hypothetical protein
MSAPTDLPWYRRTGFVVLALIFVAPVGIPLVWWNRLWSQRTRIIASIASATVFLAALVSNSNGQRSGSGSASRLPSAAQPAERPMKPAPVREERQLGSSAATTSVGAHGSGAISTPSAIPNAKPAPRKADLPIGTFVTQDGYVGALSKDALENAIGIIASGDKEAFNQLVRSNAVFPLKAGIEVNLVDTEGFLSSMVKVRARGTVLQFWTVREAIVVP